MTDNTNPPRRRSLLFWVLLAVLLVVLVAGLAVLLIVFFFVPVRVERSNLPSPALSAVSATATQVEERYGVQVTLVAPTAGGGLVDVRFRVTDPAKASFLLEAESVPALVFEKTGTTIQPREALDQDSLIQGRVYALLYPSARNEVQVGDPLGLVISGPRLEHLIVQ